ncbi:DNA polymerase III subunit delta [Bacillus sp. FJAT-45350]|uniref:DNA polymerase III subunit delta n=1 Tax=Bacillus sp. FJAT-45350 TaxID=2011014 RepID=UPI000BB7CD22|nr:DNA polymerase III subunit delta [Bacillus sp. FJAT-45350]
MSYIEMKKKLNQKKLSPVYLLAGTESFLIEDIVQQIISIALTDDERDFNLSVFEMKEISVEVAIDDAETLPFMGTRRVVLIKEAYFLTGQKDESKIEHNIKKLEQYVSNPVPETVFVIIAPYEKLDERKKITKLLKAEADVLNAKPFDDKTMGQWLNEQATSYGVTISEAGKELLLQLLGGHLLMVSKEIEKLALYVGEGGTIDIADVQNLVARTIEQDVFALIDHVVHNRLEKGLQIFYDLLKQKEDPLKLLALLARQFRIVYQVKEMTRLGYPQKQMASQLKLHPYVVKLAGQQGRNFEARHLLTLLEKLADTDFNIKSGKMDKKLALELFIMSIHQPALTKS